MPNRAHVHYYAQKQKYQVHTKIGDVKVWLADFDNEELANQMAVEAENLSRKDIPALRSKYRELRLAAKGKLDVTAPTSAPGPNSLDGLVAAARRAEEEYAAAAQTAEQLHCVALEAWAAVKSEMKAIMAASRLAGKYHTGVEIYEIPIGQIGSASANGSEFDPQD